MSDSIKQTVQWFPGHMAKTRRQIKELLPLVDAVVEVLDARVPESSRNPELSELIGNKPRIILLNKCDVADTNATHRWLMHYRELYSAAIAVDCRTGKGLNQFIPTMQDLLKPVVEKNIARGMIGKTLRIMVVGIPNTGKSSFINKMSKRNRAAVADKAGVTKQSRWFSIGNGIELLDTPGVLWPKFDDPQVGDKLAFIGSVKDTVFDAESLAVRLLDVMKKDYADRLQERYKISDFEEKESFEILELIAKKRGMILRGGVPDTERASIMLLDEYRGGKLGKITLDSLE